MANLIINLPQLQDKIKRDPTGYKDEFAAQFLRYRTALELAQLYPDNDTEQLVELMNFLASISHCYPDELKPFGMELIELLEKQGANFGTKYRNEIVKALIMMRGKEMIDGKPLFELFFKLFRLKDKKIRTTVHKFIVRDVKKINQKTKNHAMNKSLQNFMYTMLQDQDVTAAFKSLQVTEDLYKKQIWNDEKTVNVLSAACFHHHRKVQARAINFFLGNDQKEEGDEDSDSEADMDGDEKRQKEKNEEKLPSARDIMVRFAMKKGPRQKKKMKKMMKKINKRSNKPLQHDKAMNFTAVDMLHDPQEFAEKLFKQLDKISGDFELRLAHIRLIARLIGVHKLIMFNFYPYLQRFITPTQRDVTMVLQAAAHATHDLVPPEVINELSRCIANQFITDRNAGEVMAVGLNAVREVARRNPLALGEDLLQDLVAYKKHTDRGVTMAAKGIMQDYRQVAPQILAKKDRGKPNEAQKQVVLAEYGSLQSKSFLPGAEILPVDKDSDEETEEMDVEQKVEQDGEWVDVAHDPEADLDEDDIKTRMELDEQREQKIDRDELIKLKNEKAEQVVQSRILTQGEHEMIKAEQALKNVVDIRRNKTMGLDQSANSSNLVPLSKIEMVGSRRKHDKESRMETVMKGREDREKFGRARRQKHDPFASSTNKQKRKNQPFTMIKHKVSKKQSGRSYADKKKALSESLKRQIKAYKH